MKRKIATLLLVTAALLSCERDDICPESTPTTPRLVVEFRDLILTDNKKNVTKIRVEDFNDSTRVLGDYNGATKDQLLLPLKTDANSTKYRVYKEYSVLADGTIQGNPDVITIEYSTSEVYVSRACGYKSIYNTVEIIITPDTDNWMQFAIPENDNQSVINEDETHFTIRH